MRFASFALVLLLATPVPAVAQKAEPIDRRVERIEKELRAVQRKVFPGGAGMTLEPEISSAEPGTGPTGVPASNLVSDLSARVDALESQLRVLTGQTEENAHRIRLLEQALADLRAATAAPKGTERPASSAEVTSPAPAVTDPQPKDRQSPAAASGDPGEDAYLAGYRQWNQGQFGEAQKTLEAMIKKYPKHKRASFAQNLLGRSYLDGGKPATAAKIFLGNYQSNPKGERAPESLYFLGQALMKLDKKPEACKVYDELQDVYGTTLRDWLKQRLPDARKSANCG